MFIGWTSASIDKLEYDFSRRTLITGDHYSNGHRNFSEHSQIELLSAKNVEDCLPFAQDDVGTIRQKNNRSKRPGIPNHPHYDGYESIGSVNNNGQQSDL